MRFYVFHHCLTVCLQFSFFTNVTVICLSRVASEMDVSLVWHACKPPFYTLLGEINLSRPGITIVDICPIGFGFRVIGLLSRATVGVIRFRDMVTRVRLLRFVYRSQ